MHWPRAMSDLLIEPASLRRSPGKGRSQVSLEGAAMATGRGRTGVAGVLGPFRASEIDDREPRDLGARRVLEGVIRGISLMTPSQVDLERRLTSGAPPWIRTTLTVKTAWLRELFSFILVPQT